MALLTLENVSKSFGAVTVADCISLSVQPGEALGILGPNGAGKTTLFNLISGDLQPDRGRILLDGHDVSRLPPHRRCRMGIGRSYQIPQPFGTMSVFENCVTAAVFGAGLREDQACQVAVGVLRETGLIGHANAAAGGLALLNRKRLELARALCTRPRLLLLDEIAGGLTDQEAELLVLELKKIKARGVTIVWIEHVVHALLALADRLLVLNFGACIAEGEPRLVMDDTEVQRIYLGVSPDAPADDIEALTVPT